MSTQANSDDRKITIELNDYEDLEDLEWALSIAAHQMTKRAAANRRNPERRANINDARNSFKELQSTVSAARMELDR